MAVTVTVGGVHSVCVNARPASRQPVRLALSLGLVPTALDLRHPKAEWAAGERGQELRARVLPHAVEPLSQGVKCEVRGAPVSRG
eukprot:366515-Chlamydomonas_euryale.AAC.2